jgi:hypothetical protein
MMDHMKTLSRKGEVTIVEHAGGKAIVAVKTVSGDVVTLKGGTKDQLLAELCQIVKNWPDMPSPQRIIEMS